MFSKFLNLSVLSLVAMALNTLSARPAEAQSAAAKINILLLDFESPIEMDLWVTELGIQSGACEVGVDYCNDFINAYRPLNRPATNGAGGSIASFEGAFVSWIVNSIGRGKVPAPDITLISGHHLGGFSGQHGTFYMREVSKLAENPLIREFFVTPRLVYLGGCYTVKSRFAEIEKDPVAYVNRVMSHTDIRPTTELLSQAIQQLAQKDPNPWARVFPNAALVGFDQKGPGKDNLGRVKFLIHEFAKQIARNEVARGESMANEIDRLKVNHTSGRTGLFASAALWWESKGGVATKTAAKSFLPAGTEAVDTATDLRDQQQIDPTEAKLALKGLYAMIARIETESKPKAKVTAPKMTAEDTLFIKQEIIRAIGSLSPTAEDDTWLEGALLEELRSGDDDRAIFAVENFERLSAFGTDSEDALLAAANSPDPTTRLTVLRMIGNSKYRPNSLTDVLVRAFYSSDLRTREYAALALGKIGGLPSDLLTNVVRQAALEQRGSVFKIYLSAILSRNATQLSPIDVRDLIRQIGVDRMFDYQIFGIVSRSAYTAHPGLCRALRKKLAAAGHQAPPNLQAVLKSCPAL